MKIWILFKHVTTHGGGGTATGVEGVFASKESAIVGPELHALNHPGFKIMDQEDRWYAVSDRITFEAREFEVQT